MRFLRAGDGVNGSLVDPFEVGDGLPRADGWMPAVDVLEREGEYVVRIELAGLKREEIRLSFDAGCLKVEGERRQDFSGNRRFHRLERGYGRFARRIGLPGKVDAAGIRATFRDGLLEVVLSKAPEILGKRVEIKSG